MMQTLLPHKLRVLRMRQGLTLVEAAKKTGVTRATLSELERGHRHPVAPTLVKIAEGYGVPVEDLLEASPEEEAAVPLGEAAPPRKARTLPREVETRLIELLPVYGEVLDLVAEKLAADFEEIRETRDPAGLATLLAQAGLAKIATEFLRDEEILRGREDEPEEERRTREGVWRAMFRLDDLFGDIQQTIDALEEPPASVTHLADLQRLRMHAS